ncbi:hypothetical protein KC573_00970 [candidate division WWE3 bacterium]|uniref:UDP-N-acetylglucosamine 1-carboxyvinyltransferase n=1 Tax=candidate division WWE3 bacterium TaxID=2053526 RepID=A0A955RW18_UNCKA|nr:hypothetical protein [candidate division WWE3 bacterium]
MAITYIIEGGNKLHGEVTVGGSQQKAAFSIISSLLTEEKVVIHNVPQTIWVDGLLECLQFLGVIIDRKGSSVTVQSNAITTTALPANLVEKTPYSILLIGALLSRTQRVSLGMTNYSYQFDNLLFHQSIFQQALKSEVKNEDGYYVVHGEMAGTDIVLEYPSPLSSMQALFVAVSAKKPVTVKGLSVNPDVEYAKDILRNMGVLMEERKPGELFIDAGNPLNGIEITVTGDINETVFWSIVSIVTKGDISIHGVSSQEITPFLSKLTAIGIQFKLEGESLSIWCEDIKELKPVIVEIKPFPGVIPEWAGWMLVLLNRIAASTSLIQTGRLDTMNYVAVLKELGLEVAIETFEETKGGVAYPSKIEVFGGSRLIGGNVSIENLWDGLVILLAALSAQQDTTLQSTEVLDNGFENLFEKISALHGNVRAIS